MNKLDILEGEVKEFIDVTRDNIESIPSKIEGAFRIDYKEDADDFWILTNFYKQPFKPEMITEYFEGWKIVYEDETWGGQAYSIYDNGKQKIKLYTNDIGNDLIKKNQINIGTQHYRPKTLSQFITNCIQAGIKLTWKEK